MERDHEQAAGASEQEPASPDGQAEDPRKTVVQARKRAALAYNEEHQDNVVEFLLLTGEACTIGGAIDIRKLMLWQRAHGLRADGKIGPLTLGAAKQPDTKAKGTGAGGETTGGAQGGQGETTSGAQGGAQGGASGGGATDAKTKTGATGGGATDAKTKTGGATSGATAGGAHGGQDGATSGHGDATGEKGGAAGDKSGAGAKGGTAGKAGQEGAHDAKDEAKKDPTEGKDQKWSQEEIEALIASKTPEEVVQTVFSPESSPQEMRRAILRMDALHLFAPTVHKLPKKSGMAPATRAALYHLAEAQIIALSSAEKLFEYRFGLQFKSDADSGWTYTNVLSVWKQLDKLPDEHVTENTMLAVFNAQKGGGGTYSDSEKQVNIGQDTNDLSRLSHTVRHEVGHAVHEQLKDKVDPWLQNTMGFYNYPTGEEGIRAWIEDTGGWPLTYKVDGDMLPSLSLPSRRETIVKALESYIGKGSSWNPSRDDVMEGVEDKQVLGLWREMDHVRHAVQRSPAKWYKNWRSFFKGKNSGMYFLNYWYAHPIRFGTQAAPVIEATGDDYTAMSHYEFFANCYAEYFADPAGAQDASKWGGKLPANAKDFITKEILPHKPTKERKKMT